MFRDRRGSDRAARLRPARAVLLARFRVRAPQNLLSRWDPEPAAGSHEDHEDHDGNKQLHVRSTQRSQRSRRDVEWTSTSSFPPWLNRRATANLRMPIRRLDATDELSKRTVH